MLSSRYYTVTLAELYEKQGYFRKAAEIYAHLMGSEPNREDIRLALAKVKRKINGQAAPSRKELGLLFKEWEDLIQKQKGLKRK